MKNIISVSGRIGSGKDTIADHLILNYNYKKMSFAESLKDVVSSVFGWDRKLLDGSTKESREWREQVDPWWAKRLDMPNLTPRWVLQYWGTEVGRQHFHTDIWVASLENKLLTVSDKIVITDARFFNELDMINNSNGYLIRVERGPIPDWYETASRINHNLSDEELSVHPSEFRSVGYPYHEIISNDSSLDDLYNKIDLIVKN